MTDEELNAIEARANAAIPGPWQVTPGVSGVALIADEAAYRSNPYGHQDWYQDWSTRANEYGLSIHAITDADLAFLTAARTDVPALIAEVRRLTAENKRIREATVELVQREERGRNECFHDLNEMRAERDAALAEVQRLRDGAR